VLVIGGPKYPRRPTAEDRALWDAVAKTVEPLRRHTDAAATDTATATTLPPVKQKPPAGAAMPKAGARGLEPPRLAPLDRRLKARIGKGTVAIDARVDLHGLTQAAAHRRLSRFLAESQFAGAKHVLVITGKGRPADAPSISGERGVLRRLVPTWLASAEFRSFVVGFETAGRSHGAEGALYVRIRSPRKGGRA
jgi:DNA-nicking Smr family endonuclease